MQRPEVHEMKKKMIMEKCFACYCENGLASTGIKALAKACDMTSGNLYAYFENVDDLIIQSTEYCMSKVEDEFMMRAPESMDGLYEYLLETARWSARTHAKKYRFLYQVYTSPRYLEHGKKFFHGIKVRYTDYAKQLEPSLGIPWQFIQPIIFSFVKASVHFALFEDEGFLLPQLKMLDYTCKMLRKQYVGEQNETDLF